MGYEPFVAGLKGVAQSIPEGMLWQYRIVLRAGGGFEHIWILSSEAGAIHVHCIRSSFDSHSEWLGGIECHHSSPPDYMRDEKPSHELCWILHKPCWHDGTSLGFSENIAPYLPQHTNVFDESDHASVLSVMKRWHETHFSTPSKAEADG